MIAYRIAPRDRLGDAVVALRRARTRMAVVDAAGAIVTADEGARRLLNDVGGAPANRLPRAIERALHGWRTGSRSGDLLETGLEGLVVRALTLDGETGWTGLLVERVGTRESLEHATARFGFTRREVDVLRLVLEGDSAAEIADRLGIAEYTVGDYVKRLFAKTRVRNRSEMIAKVLGWHAHVPEDVFS